MILITLFRIRRRPYLLLNTLAKDSGGLPSSNFVPEKEARPKRFVYSMLPAKLHLRVILCVSVVILMGLNSFLLKEVENWKRMSFGFAIGDLVEIINVSVQISQTMFIERTEAQDQYLSFSRDVSAFMETLEELQQSIEKLERQQSQPTGRDVVCHRWDEPQRHVSKRDRVELWQELEGGEGKRLKRGSRSHTYLHTQQFHPYSGYNTQRRRSDSSIHPQKPGTSRKSASSYKFDSGALASYISTHKDQIRIELARSQINNLSKCICFFKSFQSEQNGTKLSLFRIDIAITRPGLEQAIR